LLSHSAHTFGLCRIGGGSGLCLVGDVLILPPGCASSVAALLPVPALTSGLCLIGCKSAVGSNAMRNRVMAFHHIPL
jgi:hypothetical protein